MECRGSFVETLFLLPIRNDSGLRHLYLDRRNDSMFLATDDRFMTFWLIMAGPATASALIMLFALAARRVSDSRRSVGFMQFIAPTLQFCSGIYFGEAYDHRSHLICFAFIWIGCCVFSSYDAVKVSKEKASAEIESTEA